MRLNGKIAPAFGYSACTGQPVGGRGFGSTVTVVSLPVFGSFTIFIVGGLGRGLFAISSIFLS